jgi:hypothetical protein
MEIFVVLGGFGRRKTKPIYRQFAGNPKHETRNPTTPVAWPDACCPVSVGKQVERVRLKKQTQFTLGANERKCILGKG